MLSFHHLIYLGIFLAYAIWAAERLLQIWHEGDLARGHISKKRVRVIGALSAWAVVPSVAVLTLFTMIFRSEEEGE